jgi:hypothetical protein
MAFWIDAALLGIGATAFMDLCGIVLQRLFGLAPPNYALVGRWVGHMPARFRHDAIARAPAVRGEHALGWAVHYAVGVAFAAAMLAILGVGWLDRPTPGPALATGLATLAAPFLVMQPAMGSGFFARRTPRPGAARLRSVLTHALFGFGLYVAGWAVQLVARVTA